MATMWRQEDRERPQPPPRARPERAGRAEELVVASEEQSAIAEALRRLTDRETGGPAGPRGERAGHPDPGRGGRVSTAGAVAAQLKRTRARLRVEYLLALEQAEPPTDRCRPVLLALSSADRRRQREVDAARHLLECELCARLSEPLLGRGPVRDNEIHVAISADPDIVGRGRPRASWRCGRGSPGPTSRCSPPPSRRWPATSSGSPTSGEVTIELLEQPRPGIRVVARDAGPGIPDVERR